MVGKHPKQSARKNVELPWMGFEKCTLKDGKRLSGTSGTIHVHVHVCFPLICMQNSMNMYISCFGGLVVRALAW